MTQPDPYAGIGVEIGRGSNAPAPAPAVPPPAAGVDPYAGIGSALSAAPESITPRSSSGAGAALTDIAKASFIDDPRVRARFFAARRGLPVSRYRVMGNDVLYQDDAGEWQREVPEQNITGDPKTLLQRGAAAVGPMLPIGAGTVAGIATAPMMLAGPLGLGGSMAATGGAAAGGEALKDLIGSQIGGESQMDWQSPAREAATAAVGQGIGAGIGAWMNRGAARDLAKLDRTQTANIGRKAQAIGVPLTPAEQTGLRSLKSQQTALSNLPTSGDVMEDFYKTRGQRVSDAVTAFLNRISPQDSAEVAGKGIRDTAQVAMQGARNARSTASSPQYQAAFASGASADVTGIVNDINLRLQFAKGGIADTLKRTRDLLLDKAGAPDTRIEALHSAKLEIDQMIKGAESPMTGKQSTNLGNLTGIKTKLVAALKKASPDYEAGRVTHAAMSAPLDEMEQGLVGTIAGLKDLNARKAALALFSPSSSGPNAALTARAVLEKQNPAAWQDIKRSYLQHVWERSRPRALVDAAPDLTGAAWAKALRGDTQQYGILKASLKPDELQALNDMADVFDQIASVVRRGSHTAFQTEAIADLRRDARGVVGGAARAAVNPMASFREWVDARMLGSHAEKLAEIITSPQGMKQLKALRQMSPRKAGTVAAIAQFMTQWGLSEASELDPSVPEPVPQPIQ